MFLLKTPGGSSFIWLSLKPLRKDIQRFYLKLYYLLCVDAVAYIFRLECSLFVPCLGQINAFIINLNVNEQIYIYIYIYIYVYIYIGSLQVDFRVEQCSIR